MTEADQIVRRLLENEEDDFLERQIGDDDIEELDQRNKIAIEVAGCVEDGDSIRVANEDEQPRFWSVYKRIYDFDEDGELLEALAHCVGDFDTQDEARAEAARLTEFYAKLGRLVLWKDGKPV